MSSVIPGTQPRGETQAWAEEEAASYPREGMCLKNEVQPAA